MPIDFGEFNPFTGALDAINTNIPDGVPAPRDASGGVLPVVTPLTADRWVITVSGTLPGIGVVNPGDFIIYDGAARSVVHLPMPTLQTLTVLTNGQTVFTLTAAPSVLSSGELFINGIKQVYVTDYSITGLTLTRLNTFHILNTTDVVEYIF